MDGINSNKSINHHLMKNSINTHFYIFLYSMHQTGFHVVVGLIPPSFNSFNSYLTSNGGMGYLADGRKAFNSGKIK